MGTFLFFRVFFLFSWFRLVVVFFFLRAPCRIRDSRRPTATSDYRPRWASACPGRTTQKKQEDFIESARENAAPTPIRSEPLPGHLLSPNLLHFLDRSDAIECAPFAVISEIDSPYETALLRGPTANSTAAILTKPFPV